MKNKAKKILAILGSISLLGIGLSSWYNFDITTSTTKLNQNWESYRHTLKFNDKNNAAQIAQSLQPGILPFTGFENSVRPTQLFALGYDSILYASANAANSTTLNPWLFNDKSRELTKNDNTKLFNISTNYTYWSSHHTYVGAQLTFYDDTYSYDITINCVDTESNDIHNIVLAKDIHPNLDMICSSAIDLTFNNEADKWNYTKMILTRSRIQNVIGNTFFFTSNTNINDKNELVKGDYMFQINNNWTIRSYPCELPFYSRTTYRRFGTNVGYANGKYYMFASAYTPSNGLRTEMWTTEDLSNPWDWPIVNRGVWEVVHFSSEATALRTPNWGYLKINNDDDWYYGRMINYDNEFSFYSSFKKPGAWTAVTTADLIFDYGDKSEVKDKDFDFNIVDTMLVDDYMYFYAKNSVANQGQFLGNIVGKFNIKLYMDSIRRTIGYNVIDWKGYNTPDCAISIYTCADPYIVDPGSVEDSPGFVPIPSSDGSKIFLFQNYSTNVWIIDTELDYKYGMLLDNFYRPINKPIDTKNTKWRNIGSMSIYQFNKDYANLITSRTKGIDWRSAVYNNLKYLYSNYPSDISINNITVSQLATRPLIGEIDLEITLNKVYFNGEIRTDKNCSGKLTIKEFKKTIPTPDNYSFKLANTIEIKQENTNLIFNVIKTELIDNNIIPYDAIISMKLDVTPNPQFNAKKSAIYQVTSSKYFDDKGNIIETPKDIVVIAISTHPTSWKQTSANNGIQFSVKKDSELTTYIDKTLNDIDPYYFNEFLFNHKTQIFNELPEGLLIDNCSIKFYKKESLPKEGKLVLGFIIDKIYVDDHVENKSLECKVSIVDFKLQPPSNLKDIDMKIGNNKIFPEKNSAAFNAILDEVKTEILTNNKYILPPDTKVNLLLKSRIKDGAVFIASINQYYDQNGWYVNQYKPFYVTTSGYQVDNNLPSREDATNIRYFRKIDLSIFNWIYSAGFWVTIIIVILIPIIITSVTVYAKKRNKF